MNIGIRIVFVLVVMMGCLGGIAFGAEKYQLSPELRRKLAHIVIGLITVSFPWLFDRPLWVWLLASVSMVLMLALRLKRMARMGNVIHGVKRQSFGDLCFPVVVALTFQFSDGEPLLFVVPMLVLALADAAGALIGLYYGRSAYATEEGAKTIEGSLAVGFVTFLCVHLPLLLATEIGRLECVLISLLVAFMVVGVEAISLRGLDNLYLPLVVLGLVVEMGEATINVLVQRVLVLAVVVVGGSILQRRADLSATALLAAMLAHFYAWAMAGQGWLWPMLLTSVVYTFLSGWQRQQDRPRHGLFGVMSVAAAPMFWLLAGQAGEWPMAWGAYSMALALQSGLMVALHLEGLKRLIPRWVAPLGAAFVIMVQLILGAVFAVGFSSFLSWVVSPTTVTFALRGGAVGLAVTMSFLLIERARGGPKTDTFRWFHQAGIVLLGSAAGLFY